MGGGLLMYNITIIDDNQQDLDYIFSLIDDYCQINKHEVKIQCFNDPLQIKDLIRQDIIFLDIDMPTINGIEFATSLSNNTVIIFVTNMEHLVFDSFKVHPFDFIRKSQMDKELSYTLKAVFNLINEKTKYLILKTYQGKAKIKINNILFCETTDHITTIYTVNESFQVRKSLKEIMKMINSNNFLHINKSYYINIDYVKVYDRKKVIMNNDKIISIGRDKYHLFIERYLS